MIKVLRQNFSKWLIQLIMAAEEFMEKWAAVPLMLCKN